MNNIKFEDLEVVKQTKLWLASCLDENGQARKEPRCYIHFKKGRIWHPKNEFWALMCGENALRVFKPGQKVEAELSFTVHKTSRRNTQRVLVNKISLKPDIQRVNFPWVVSAPWDNV